MRRFLLFLSLLAFYPAFTNAWADQPTEFVKTSPTVFGPSGLLFTQSADTLAPGQVEIGASFAHEQFDRSHIKRYVTSHLNLTGGIQKRIRSETGANDTTRFIVQGSYLF